MLYSPEAAKYLLLQRWTWLKYTSRSNLAFETHTMKCPAGSFWREVDASGGLELCSYWFSRAWRLLHGMCLRTQLVNFILFATIFGWFAAFPKYFCFAVSSLTLEYQFLPITVPSFLKTTHCFIYRAGRYGWSWLYPNDWESVGGSNTLYHTKLFLMDTHVAIR